MVKTLICPECGGKLVPFGGLPSFLMCPICGRVVNKEAAEEHAAEVGDG